MLTPIDYSLGHLAVGHKSARPITVIGRMPDAISMSQLESGLTVRTSTSQVSNDSMPRNMNYTSLPLKKQRRASYLVSSMSRTLMSLRENGMPPAHGPCPCTCLDANA
jgi:hypothetical protein